MAREPPYYSGMDSQTLISGLLTVAVGAISGGITNAVAIWMLFHPYELRGVWPFRLQGAIPKNKARLAKSIGKTVGEKLLTPADLSHRLSAPEVRAAFDAALTGFLDEMLERERGPLADLLPSSLAAELDAGSTGSAQRAADDLAAYTAGPALRGPGRRAGSTTLAGGVRRPADRRTSSLPTRRAQFSARPTDGSGSSPRGRISKARSGISWTSSWSAWARTNSRWSTAFPPGLVGTVEASINDYLPVAIERIGAVLSDPEAKGRIHLALRTAFDRAVRDLLLHERLLAKLVVTDQTFTRLLDGLERDGFERFAESLAAPEMRLQLDARGQRRPGEFPAHSAARSPGGDGTGEAGRAGRHAGRLAGGGGPG